MVNSLKLIGLVKNKLKNVIIFCFISLQDLQAEIEAHQSVFTSMNDAGEGLLQSGELKEGAEDLQNRLENMNQRWTKLQNKSAEIR